MNGSPEPCDNLSSRHAGTAAGRGLVKLGAASLLLQAAPAIPARAATPGLMQLEPTSDWILTQKPESCVLARQFGNGDRTVLLQLENYTLGQEFRTYLITGDFKIRKALPRVAFLPGGVPDEKGFSSAILLKDGRTAVVFSASVFTGTKYSDYSDPSEPDSIVASRDELEAREKAVDRMFVGDVFERDIVLHTGSMRSAITTMQSCTDVLARAHGLDPIALRSSSRRAKPVDLNYWAKRIQESYPAMMRLNNLGSQVVLRIFIDAQGNVTDCSGMPEGQPQDFAASACRVTKKQKFAPALDAAGNPIASVYSTRIRYRIVG